MVKPNLFEMLGKPVLTSANDDGTVYTFTSESWDEDNALPTVSNLGTVETREDGETFDDNAVLDALVVGLTTSVTATTETFDDSDALPYT